MMAALESAPGAHPHTNTPQFTHSINIQPHWNVMVEAITMSSLVSIYVCQYPADLYESVTSSYPNHRTYQMLQRMQIQALDYVRT